MKLTLNTFIHIEGVIIRFFNFELGFKSQILLTPPTKHVRLKISAGGGLSRGSSVCRPGSEDPESQIVLFGSTSTDSGSKLVPQN